MGFREDKNTVISEAPESIRGFLKQFNCEIFRTKGTFTHVRSETPYTHIVVWKFTDGSSQEINLGDIDPKALGGSGTGYLVTIYDLEQNQFYPAGLYSPSLDAASWPASKSLRNLSGMMSGGNYAHKTRFFESEGILLMGCGFALTVCPVAGFFHPLAGFAQSLVGVSIIVWWYLRCKSEARKTNRVGTRPTVTPEVAGELVRTLAVFMQDNDIFQSAWSREGLGKQSPRL